MLILTRKLGESINIGDNIKVTVLGIYGRQVRLGIDAPLKVARGIVHEAQPELALGALRHALEALDDLSLTALDCAVRASGSLVVALALQRGRLDAEAAFEAAELDASFQIEQWGEDPEATRRRDAVRADLAAARRLFDLLCD